MPNDAAIPPGVFLDCAQAALFLGVHRNSIQNWIKADTLKAYKVGRQWRILKRDLVACMTRGTQ